jgi:hypothetical protein
MTEQTAPYDVGPRSRRTRSLWRRLGRLSSALTRWPVIAVLFLAAMVLGWIGFDGNMAALHEPGTFLDKLYRSAQLFVLHSGDVPPPVPWQLEVARFSRRP